MIVNNVIWSFVQNISIKALQFVFGIILARLLTPEDFGIVAITLFFITISQSISESGLGVALVRNSDVTQRDYETVFTFSFVIGLLFYLLIFIFSDTIASFYDSPILSNVLKVLGVKIILNSCLITFYSTLRKQRNLRLIAGVTILSSLISYAIAIVLAYMDYGIWSIVVMHILTVSFTLLLYLIKFKKIPKFRFYKNNFKALFSFGGNLLFSSIINRFFNNVNSLVIGKFLNLNDVGVFQRANSLQQIPIQTISVSISGGIGPSLYKLQDDKQKLNHLNRLIFEMSFVLVLLICCFLFFFSREIIIVVLTEKWLAVAPILKLFSIVGLFYPFFTFFNTYFKVIGKTKVILKLELISKIVLFLSLGFIFIWQLNGVVYGIVITYFLQAILSFYFLRYYKCYSYAQLLEDLKKPFLIFIVLFLSMYLLDYLNFSSGLIKLLVMMFCSGVIFSVLFLIFYNEECRRILKIIK